MEIIKVKITDEYITLGQFIKIVDLVSSGGQVKMFLLSNEIKVNNELENRRGKKLYIGDHITIFNKEYVIC